MAAKEIQRICYRHSLRKSPSYATVKYLTVELKQCCDSTEDDTSSARPKNSTFDEQVDDIQRIVLDDGHLTVPQIAKSRGISSGSVPTI